MPAEQKRTDLYLSDNQVKIGDINFAGLHPTLQKRFLEDSPIYKDLVLKEHLFDNESLDAWKEEEKDALVVTQLEQILQFMDREKVAYIRAILA